MSLIPGSASDKNRVIHEELDGDYFELVAGQYRSKAVPTEIIESSATGATTAPVKPTGDWLHLDTGKGVNPFISGVWDATAGAWVNVSSQIWDKDRNTGITVEEGANDNSIRAYIGGVDGGVTDATHTSWGLSANTGGVTTNATAVGSYANYQNTGVNATGTGLQANFQNTGGNATGTGVQANYQNTGVNVTGTGLQANFQNTGVNVTAVGSYANYQNTGVNATGTGLQANYQNTGGNVTGTGLQANYQNTGVNVTAVGSYANYQNTGGNVTGTGVQANYQNTGVNATGTGVQANFQNTGSQNSGFGARSLMQQAGSRNTGIGYSAFGNGVIKTISPSDVNIAANTLIIPAHSYGSPGEKLGIVIPIGSTPPAPLYVGASELVEIIDANTVKFLNITLTALPAGPFTLQTSLRVNNSSALGYSASPDKDNQIVLGDTLVEELKTAAASVITGVYPQFATDAAATAALPKGQLYHLTANPVVRQVL